jgi:hypothetical protein
MPVVVSADRTTRPRGLILWRVLVWLILLVAAFGCLQYVQHAQHVWTQLQSTAPGDAQAISAMHGMLRWDAAYLFAAFALIVICAGCILRQSWALPCMRVAAVLLAVWLLATGIFQLRDLQALAANSASIVTQARQQGTVDALQIMARLQRTYQLALLFKTIGLIALLWLGWMLGKPSVRAQFHTRR